MFLENNAPFMSLLIAFYNDLGYNETRNIERKTVC
ncbi:Uncharacterised protein [Streptococcus pneumoniae]|nr:Uncharacterised protein [Streptococcus pneumoniae]